MVGPDTSFDLYLCTQLYFVFSLALSCIFSVTRRSRSDAVHFLPSFLMVSIDLTDVTLVSDDT